MIYGYPYDSGNLHFSLSPQVALLAQDTAAMLAPLELISLDCGSWPWPHGAPGINTSVAPGNNPGLCTCVAMSTETINNLHGILVRSYSHWQTLENAKYGCCILILGICVADIPWSGGILMILCVV